MLALEKITNSFLWISIKAKIHTSEARRWWWWWWTRWWLCRTHFSIPIVFAESLTWAIITGLSWLQYFFYFFAHIWINGIKYTDNKQQLWEIPISWPLQTHNFSSFPLKSVSKNYWSKSINGWYPFRKLQKGDRNHPWYVSILLVDKGKDNYFFQGRHKT